MTTTTMMMMMMLGLAKQSEQEEAAANTYAAMYRSLVPIVMIMKTVCLRMSSKTVRSIMTSGLGIKAIYICHSTLGCRRF